MSQLDLALEIGWENPSTLSRIESGQVVPSRETLIRICKALRLNNYEIDFLLSKLGYIAQYPHVDEEYMQKMSQLYEEELSSFPFPTFVEYTRKFIYINDKAKEFFLKNNPVLKNAIKNKTYLELIFLSEYGLKDKIVNWEEFARYVTFNSNMLMPTMFVEASIGILDNNIKERIFNEMSKLGNFSDLKSIKYNIPFIYNHPKVGTISFVASQFPLHFDDRFYIMQLIPATSKDLILFTKYINKN